MVSQEDLEKIKRQLGRTPRGVKKVVCYNKLGDPRVIRVTPFVAGMPFPSHYWLCCPILKKRIDQLEAIGWASKIEDEYINSDEDFKAEVHADHKRYIKDRLQFIKDDGLEGKIEDNLMAVLIRRGVGGIEDFNRVRCLHMHYAHHLADSNRIGSLMDELFELDQI